MKKINQRIYWHWLWHFYVLRHAACWMSCGDWVTNADCFTCNKRWEA